MVQAKVFDLDDYSQQEMLTQWGSGFSPRRPLTFMESVA